MCTPQNSDEPLPPAQRFPAFGGANRQLARFHDPASRTSNGNAAGPSSAARSSLARIATLEVESIEILPEYTELLNLLTQGSAQVVLLSGRAGTGKSTAIRWLLRTLGEGSAVVAPTGIAARNIGGQTIHALFGFQIGLIEPSRISGPSNRTRGVFQRLKYLIIDECSMVNANIMDAIEIFLRQHGPATGVAFSLASASLSMRLRLFSDA